MAYRIIKLKRFERDYLRLSVKIQNKTDAKLFLLRDNLHHPSLRIKRFQSLPNVYEGSIDMNYRFLFQINGNDIILLRIGKHDILNKG